MKWISSTETKEARGWHPHFVLWPVWLQDRKCWAWLETVWRGDFSTYCDEIRSGGWSYRAAEP